VERQAHPATDGYNIHLPGHIAQSQNALAFADAHVLPAPLSALHQPGADKGGWTSLGAPKVEAKVRPPLRQSVREKRCRSGKSGHYAA